MPSHIKKIGVRDPKAIARGYIARLLAARNKSEAVLAGLPFEPYEVGIEVVRQAIKVPRLRTQIVGCGFPSEFSEIQTLDPPPFYDLDVELQWTAIALVPFAEEIQQFGARSELFEAAYLVGDNERATKILDEIEALFGVSLWLAQSRLLVAEATGGLSSNREFARTLTVGDTDRFARAIVNLLSMRAEAGMSPANYLASLNSSFPSDRTDLAYRSMVLHVRQRAAFGSVSSADLDELSVCIAREHRFPVIDRYLGLLRAIELLMATRPLHEVMPLWGKALRRLAATANDSRLQMVDAAVGTSRLLTSLRPNPDLVAATNSYALGDYNLALQMSRCGIESSPTTFEFYELFAKARNLLQVSGDTDPKPKSISAQVLSTLCACVDRQPDTAAALQHLLKIATTMGNMRFGAQLLAFYLKRRQEGDRLRARALEATNATAATPRAAFMFDEPARARRYLNELKNAGVEGAALNTIDGIYGSIEHGAIIESLDNLPTNRAIKYKALVLERLGELNAAIKEWRRLYDAGVERSTFLQSSALSGLFRCLVRLSRFDELLIQLVDAYLSNPRLLSLWQVERVLSEYPDSVVPAVARDPAFPLLWYVRYQLSEEKRDPDSVFAAIDTFLGANGVLKPSELDCGPTTQDNPRLLAFLREAAVPTFLDSSVFFANSDELEAERVQICKELIQREPTRAASYEAEISDLTKRGVIRRAIQKVDRSKVHVDTAGIRQSLPKQFLESVQRYHLMQSLREDLRQVVKVSLGDKGDVLLIFDSETALFRDIFLTIRDRFISSDEFGLDSYLSVRVRHGTLSGQLRSAFERYFLITRRDTANGPYDRNLYWLEALGGLPDHKAQRLGQCFERLSGRVDSIIDRAKNHWVQIRTAKGPQDAVFDFDYSHERLKAAMQAAGSAQEQDDFFDRIFDILWARTEENLDILRNRIRGQLAKELFDALDEFEGGLDSVLPRRDQADLRTSVTHCRTDVQNEIDVLVGWFFVDRESAMQDFDFDLLIETTIEVVRKTLGVPAFAPAVGIRSASMFRGVTFRHFVDLLYILIENIAKHSRATLNSAEIDVDEDEEWLVIRVSNVLADVARVDWAELSRELEHHANETERRSAVRREGGSGYYKLGKILRSDLDSARSRVEVNASGEKFAVTIRLEREGLV